MDYCLLFVSVVILKHNVLKWTSFPYSASIFVIYSFPQSSTILLSSTDFIFTAHYNTELSDKGQGTTILHFTGKNSDSLGHT